MVIGLRIDYTIWLNDLPLVIGSGVEARSMQQQLLPTTTTTTTSTTTKTTTQ